MQTHSLAALFALALPGLAQDLTVGVVTDPQAEADDLFHYPASIGLITNVVATHTAESTSFFCTPGTNDPFNTQFATAANFLGPNGFVLSNGFVEDMDDDGVATGVTGCVSVEGDIQGTVNCNGRDPLLEGFLAGTDAVVESSILEVTFDVIAPCRLDVAYNFVTFEDPTNNTFWDTFGIAFDDGVGGGPVLLAGGQTNTGPEGATDPWTLTPSSGAPSEYQSVPANVDHVVPAHHTGRRNLTLNLTPGVGQTLSFHVADSGLPTPNFCGPGTNTACSWVQSMLMGGLTVYASPNAAGTTAGTTIDYVGHPSSGGPFAPDLLVNGSGFAPGVPMIFAQSGNQLPPFTVALLAPLEIVVAPPFNLSFATSDAAGEVTNAPTPPPLPPGLTGDFYFQWWALAGLTLENSPGLRIVFE